MNATGESDIRNYYDAIQAKQENTLTPALRRLDEIIIRLALGNRPADIWYDWASLWNVSDAEKASIAKTKAEVTAIYNQAGIFTRETLAKVAGNQLIEDGLYPGLEDALEEEQAALESGVLPEEEGEPDPDEDDEELFRQAAE